MCTKRSGIWLAHHSVVNHKNLKPIEMCEQIFLTAFEKYY